MTSPLERLAGPGKSLTVEPPDAKEFARLKHSGADPLSIVPAGARADLSANGMAVYHQKPSLRRWKYGNQGLSWSVAQRVHL